MIFKLSSKAVFSRQGGMVRKKNHKTSLIHKKPLPSCRMLRIPHLTAACSWASAAAAAASSASSAAVPHRWNAGARNLHGQRDGAASAAAAGHVDVVDVDGVDDGGCGSPSRLMKQQQHGQSNHHGHHSHHKHHNHHQQQQQQYPLLVRPPLVQQRRQLATWPALNLRISSRPPPRSYAVVKPGKVTAANPVPAHIPRPPYALTRDGVPQAVPEPTIKTTAAELDGMRQACQLAARVLRRGGELARQPGITTDAIDRELHDMIIAAGAYPSPLGYRGFPRAVCTSVNNVVCHGIPDDRALVDGDIVNVDVSVYLNGFHGDCSQTFAVGGGDLSGSVGSVGSGGSMKSASTNINASASASANANASANATTASVGAGGAQAASKGVDAKGLLLIRVANECLQRAISICRPGVRISRIGTVIEQHAVRHGFTVCGPFTGHGIGRSFHEPPHVVHVVNSEPGVMVEGMTFTIEPAINEGREGFSILPDGWTAVTNDNGRSAQCEHTVLITKEVWCLVCACVCVV